MNRDEILIGLYDYLAQQLPATAINLIIQNDIRVENYFAINAGVYLDSILATGHINSYRFQHTILLVNPRRTHIDISFTENNLTETYLELKHFSISQNRGPGRGLNFYTSNSIEGKKVGIIGDCEKLDSLRDNGYLANNIQLVCCAFITQKPTQQQINGMTDRFHLFPELVGWNLAFPKPFDEQNQNLGMITLQK
jgi:hypothetical protein